MSSSWPWPGRSPRYCSAWVELDASIDPEVWFTSGRSERHINDDDVTCGRAVGRRGITWRSSRTARDARNRRRCAAGPDLLRHRRRPRRQCRRPQAEAHRTTTAPRRHGGERRGDRAGRSLRRGLDTPLVGARTRFSVSPRSGRPSCDPGPRRARLQVLPVTRPTAQRRRLSDRDRRDPIVAVHAGLNETC